MSPRILPGPSKFENRNPATTQPVDAMVLPLPVSLFSCAANKKVEAMATPTVVCSNLGVTHTNGSSHTTETNRASGKSSPSTFFPDEVVLEIVAVVAIVLGACLLLMNTYTYKYGELPDKGRRRWKLRRRKGRQRQGQRQGRRLGQRQGRRSVGKENEARLRRQTQYYWCLSWPYTWCQCVPGSAGLQPRRRARGSSCAGSRAGWRRKGGSAARATALRATLFLLGSGSGINFVGALNDAEFMKATWGTYMWW